MPTFWLAWDAIMEATYSQQCKKTAVKLCKLKSRYSASKMAEKQQAYSVKSETIILMHW